MQSDPDRVSGTKPPPEGQEPLPEEGGGFPRSPLEPTGIVGGLVAALALSALSTLAAFAYFLYLSDRFPDQVRGIGPAAWVLDQELNRLMAVTFLCSFIGFTFSRRYGLPGLGAIPGKARDLALVAGGGAVLGILSFFVFDRSFRRMVPAYYPDTLAGALTLVPNSALPAEIVIRFGMMTILTGVFRRPLIANLLAAGFFTVVTGYKQIHFAGVSPDPMNPVVLVGLALTLLAHAILGTLYVKKGLFPCVVFHLAMDLKYLLCPFV